MRSLRSWEAGSTGEPGESVRVYRHGKAESRAQDRSEAGGPKCASVSPTPSWASPRFPRQAQSPAMSASGQKSRAYLLRPRPHSLGTASQPLLCRTFLILKNQQQGITGPPAVSTGLAGPLRPPILGLSTFPCLLGPISLIRSPFLGLLPLPGNSHFISLLGSTGA